MTTTEPTKYLSIVEVAERCGVRREWIDRLRSRGDMPPPDITVGRTPGWRPEVIDEWWANRRHGPGRPPRI